MLFDLEIVTIVYILWYSFVCTFITYVLQMMGVQFYTPSMWLYIQMYEAIDRALLIPLIMRCSDAKLCNKVAYFLQQIGCNFLHHQFDYYIWGHWPCVSNLFARWCDRLFSHQKRLICLFYFWCVAFSLL